MFLSPLSQFKINLYLSLFFVSLTNFSLTAIFFIGGLILFFVGGTGTHKVKSNFINRTLYNLVLFIYNVVASGLTLNAVHYFGVVLTLFISIFGFNLAGLIPYSFTLTSHLIIALSFSVPVFIAMTGEAIYRHKGAFFGLFLPAGVPVALIPVLTLIEFISYVARVFSLAIRLAANLIAGHVLLKIIATTCASLFAGGIISISLSFLPLGVLFVFYILELAVAGLQAYVFAVLCCNYLNDGIAMSH